MPTAVRLVFRRASWTPAQLHELFQSLDYLPQPVGKFLGERDWEADPTVRRIRLGSPLEITLVMEVAAITTALVTVLNAVRDYTPTRRGALAEVHRKELENERLQAQLSSDAMSKDLERRRSYARVMEAKGRLLEERLDILARLTEGLLKQLAQDIAARTERDVEALGGSDARRDLARILDDFAETWNLTEVDVREVDHEDVTDT